MALTDAQLKQVARAAYERSRWALAAQVAGPVTVVPVLSWVLGTRWPSALGLGAALVAVLAVLVWRGGALAFGGLTGLKAGVVPLALAHASKLWGHVCTPAGCTTLCVPACATGGLLAGLLVERWARRSPRPGVTRALGAAVCLLTGGLGCSCVGYAGLAGMVMGLVVSMGAGVFLSRSAA